MIEIINIANGIGLADYASHAFLSGAVSDLRSKARALVPKLSGRKIWMINSTANGGGVAEMMPKMIDIFRELGVNIDWAVISPDEKDFFQLTKRIHNLIHDFGNPGFSDEEKTLYNRVSRNMADQLEKLVAPQDILVIHDPQPLGAGSELIRRIGLQAIWRCHIGLDRRTPNTASVWNFIKPHTKDFQRAVFSAFEYIPSFLTEKAEIITPAIDPLSQKNRDLSGPELIHVLCNAGLMKNGHPPFLTSRWKRKAQRLQPNGRFTTASIGDEMDLLFRPIISQVSRWDQLKGWKPLCEAFILFKERVKSSNPKASVRYNRLNNARLLLVGPEPAAVQDDPEGKGVLKSLCNYYLNLTPEQQESIVLLTLPMGSRDQNHQMVNAIQRCSTLVIQNSLQEGFGLTATEAMWKKRPVLGTSSCGLRLQIRNGIEGRLTGDPNDPEEIANNLNQMLASSKKLEKWGRNAQRRVYDRFLVFSQINKWLECLADVSERPKIPSSLSHR